MRRNRRKVFFRIMEGAAVGLVVLDALLYGALLRPLRRAAAEKKQEVGQTRSRIQDETMRVESLKRYLAALPTASADIKAFVHEHVPPRRWIFSRASGLVRRLAEQSDLQLSPVSYRLDSSPAEALERLGVELTVEGTFSNLLRFAHSLETANEFILVRDFTFQPGEKGRLALRMTAELYLEP
ncbi:MAG: hypothetical protein DMG23_04735 [Acidobacteria bacterium]|nr:MAG: hypothetical protein DMG23_04735 [Acidobacteriota bacterium]